MVYQETHRALVSCLCVPRVTAWLSSAEASQSWGDALGHACQIRPAGEDFRVHVHRILSCRFLVAFVWPRYPIPVVLCAGFSGPWQEDGKALLLQVATRGSPSLLSKARPLCLWKCCVSLAPALSRGTARDCFLIKPFPCPGARLACEQSPPLMRSLALGESQDLF